jgi:ABC-2 type transport system permease protein
MRQLRSFVIKETRHILRDRRTMLILFGMPVVMMLLFGFAISTDVRNVRVAVVTSSADHAAQQAVVRLGASSYFDILYKVGTPAEAERLIRRQKADLAVVFGSGYADGRGGVQVITDGADPNMARMYSRYASEVLAGAADIPLRTALLFNPQMRSCYNFVPGIMGMLLMLVCAMMTSISIVREKERGTMEVLLVSPVRPLLVIAAKVVPYLALAFCILCFILAISHFVLGVPVAGGLGWIFLVSGVYIVVALSLGILISTVARTQLEALLASAMMLILPCILLSGMMFPIESMPEPLQWLSAVMPPRYYISAVRKLMIMGVGAEKVVREAAVLSCMAAALLSAALLNFKDRL